MATDSWNTRNLSVAGLHLDAKNPRLGRETSTQAPREIIQYLFEHDKALDVAESIAIRGYFPNEPLLAVKENNRTIIVEGTDGRWNYYHRRITDLKLIAKVPVTIAPNRRSTDRQIAGRHIGSTVLPWQAENRASFILDKLAEGYENDELRDDLGFSLAHSKSPADKSYC